jgi:hypothetical protein
MERAAPKSMITSLSVLMCDEGGRVEDTEMPSHEFSYTSITCKDASANHNKYKYRC